MKGKWDRRSARGRSRKKNSNWSGKNMGSNQIILAKIGVVKH
jgi:hypothetical protein